MKRLAAEGHTIVLPCRSMKKSLDAVESLSSFGGNLLAAECDLASLSSIQKFAKELPSIIGDKKIDVLCLNAGLSRDTGATECIRTEDGFELTGQLSKQQLLASQHTNPTNLSLIQTTFCSWNKSLRALCA